MSENNKGILSKVFSDVLPSPIGYSKASSHQYAYSTSKTSNSTPITTTIPTPTPTSTSISTSQAYLSSSKPVSIVSSIQVGGVKPKMPKTQTQIPIQQDGGAIKSLIDARPLFARFFVIIFIFSLGIYLASVVFQSNSMVKNILKLKGEGEDADPNFEDSGDHMERWRKILQMIIVFVCLVIAFTIALFVFIYVMLLLYYSNKDGIPDPVPFVKEKMKKWFMSFEVDGFDYDLRKFYILAVVLLFGSMLFFMLYFIFVKSYLQNIYYQNDINVEKSNKAEFLNSYKFINYYGLYLVLLLLFSLLLISIFYLTGNNLLYLSLFYIIVSMMFVMLISKYTLERSAWRIFVLMLVFLIFVISLIKMMYKMIKIQ